MKLSVKDLVIPTKEIKVTGFKDTVTIYPIGGFALMKLKDLSAKLAKDKEDIETQEECVRFALKWGCKCSEEDIEYLIQNDLIASIEITKEVIEYASEYNEAKMKESDLAKKKLKK